MRQQTQTALSERLLELMDARSTQLLDNNYHNPVYRYTCAQWAQKEQQTLFSRYPLVVASSCQLPRATSYLTHDLSGKPLLIVRGNDERVRSFLNVCRHRGARPANADGEAPGGFVCPYHGWCFDVQGKLASVPNAAAFSDIDFDEYGLTPVPCAERDGLIWVLPQASPWLRDTQHNPIDLDGYLSGLSSELSEYEIANHHFYKRTEIEQDMNWKLLIDTFLEPYHFPVLHRDTVNPIFVPNTCVADLFGPHVREVLPRRTLESQRHLDPTVRDLITHSAIVYVLFPNTVLVVQIDHLEIWSVFPKPGRVDQCSVVLDFLVPEPVTSEKARVHWERNLDLTLRTVLTEDFPVGTNIQRGFAANAQTALVYGKNEPALAMFERTVAEQVEWSLNTPVPDTPIAEPPELEARGGILV